MGFLASVAGFVGAFLVAGAARAMLCGAVGARLWGTARSMLATAARPVVAGRRPALRRALPGGTSPAAQLPFALDVWAAVLAAGEPMMRAIGAAAACCDGELATRLTQVREGMAAGLTSAQAWAVGLAGSDAAGLSLAAQACQRSERDGTPLAPVLRRLASEERSAAASRGLKAARRAGVLAVLPLGLCTLPAYVLLSVAPAVIGLFHRRG